MLQRRWGLIVYLYIRLLEELALDNEEEVEEVCRRNIEIQGKLEELALNSNSFIVTEKKAKLWAWLGGDKMS